MASQIFALDIQADALRLVLQPPGKPPRFYKKALPAGLLSDPEGLSAGIRQLLQEAGISCRRCVLVLPRQHQPEALRPVLKKAGLVPLRAFSREDACGALLGESGCLVVPEGGGFQAVFLHQGRTRMARGLEDARSLDQILRIYRFSNPDLPASTVYLPGHFPGTPAGDWDIRPLEALLPPGLPAESAAGVGALKADPGSGFPYPPDLAPRGLWRLAALVLAISLFLYGGIFRPLTDRNEALAELSRQQALAGQFAGRLADYDALYSDYLRTGGGILTEAELSLADRTAIVDLVDRVIFPRARVTEFTLSGNSLTLRLTGISLKAAGSLVSELKEQPLISEAQLHSVEAASGESSSIFLRITLAEANQEDAP